MAEETSIVGLPRFNNQAMALAPAAAGAGADTGLTTEMSAADTMVAIFKDMRDSLDQLVTFASKQIKPIISIPSNLTTIDTSINNQSSVGDTAEEKKDKEPGKIASMLSSLRTVIGEKFIGKKGLGAVDATDGSLSKGLVKAPDALTKFMAGFGGKPDMVKSKAGDSYAADSTQGKVIVQSQKEKEESGKIKSEEETSAPTIAPMQGMMDIFIAIRDGINTLVFLAGGSTTEKSAAADKAGAAESAAADKAGAADKITARKENLADSEGKKDEPKKQGMIGSLKDTFTSEAIGDDSKMMSKLIKVGILGAMALLLKFSEEFESAIAFVLEKGKMVFDMLGPNGKMILGLTALAAFIMPKTLMALVTGVGKGTLKGAMFLLKGGFGKMKDFITGPLVDGLKSAYGGAKGFLSTALTKVKSAFVAMKVFLLDSMIPAIKSAAGGIKGKLMSAVTKIGMAFTTMRLFLIDSMIPAIKSAAGGVGGKLMSAVTKLGVAFTAMRVFLIGTMIPAITTMMAPFIVPLALVVAAVLAAVAIFTSIKAGIDEFKQSLADGDSMLEAIISGVATALLTLVTLPITLIKNFVAWVAEKLGFEGIAKKLREFSFVDSIKNGITNLVTKIKDFVVGLMGFDKIKSFFAKIGSIGGMIMDFVKAITAGAAAAIWPGLKPFGNGPEFEYKKAFDASMAGSEAKRIEKADAKFKLAELAEVEAENQKIKKNEQKMNFYTTTTTNKAGDTINSNAVTLANLSANHTEPTQMQLNMASR